MCFGLFLKHFGHFPKQSWSHWIQYWAILIQKEPQGDEKWIGTYLHNLIYNNNFVNSALHAQIQLKRGKATKSNHLYIDQKNQNRASTWQANQI
jgi:hypothetical protein